MLQWFQSLPPGEQLAIAGQFVWLIFSAGVYYATIRALRQAIVELKATDKEHAEKLEEHGQEIAELKGAQHARAAGR